MYAVFHSFLTQQVYKKLSFLARAYDRLCHLAENNTVVHPKPYIDDRFIIRKPQWLDLSVYLKKNFGVSNQLKCKPKNLNRQCDESPGVWAQY